jgi:TRAP transporter TAXI family solute receptor
MKIARLIGAFTAAATLAVAPASAETRITYKSAKSTSSYFQMAVQLAEAMKTASNGEIILTVEESQGSVQNVMEAPRRGGNYVFTTPPALVRLAGAGKAMFEGKANPGFKEIRALFPIPSLTMHFVVNAESGVTSIDQLGGKSILLGKGSFGAKEGAKYLGLFGVEDSVMQVDAELSNAVPALKNEQIDGFVTAGSFPAPNVIEAAASMDVRVLSLSEDQIAETKRTRLEIPAGTYKGQDEPIVTTSLPVVAYTTTEMSDETAYQLTRTYWRNKKAMAQDAPWWDGVDESFLANIDGEIHPGAIRYYKSVGWIK